MCRIQGLKKKNHFAKKPFIFGQEATTVLHRHIQCSPLHLRQRNTEVEAEMETTSCQLLMILLHFLLTKNTYF